MHPPMSLPLRRRLLDRLGAYGSLVLNAEAVAKGDLRAVVLGQRRPELYTPQPETEKE